MQKEIYDRFKDIQDNVLVFTFAEKLSPDTDLNVLFGAGLTSRVGPCKTDKVLSIKLKVSNSHLHTQHTILSITSRT